MQASRLCFIILLVCGLLAGGCVNSPSHGNPGAEPAVLIVSPEFDGGVLTGDVQVEVRVTNFSPGAGHLIYYRDAVPPVDQGRPAYSDPGTYAVSDSLVYIWHNVTPGTHTFAVQLVNPGDTPLDPPVIDAVDVTAVPQNEIAGS